jgi:molybdate transport system permease protein
VIDWQALSLSLQLAAATALLLLPLAIWLARLLAWSQFRHQAALEAAILLPLVLPPTVLGYYLLLGFGGASPLGQAYHALTGRALVFSFDGLLAASLIFNLPFAVQPMQRSFAAIPREVREAAWVSGLSRWQTFLRIELPLAWPGIAAALALTFAHTLGEFGVVLMVGGSLPGETKTDRHRHLRSGAGVQRFGGGRHVGAAAGLSFVRRAAGQSPRSFGAAPVKLVARLEQRRRSRWPPTSPATVASCWRWSALRAAANRPSCAASPACTGRQTAACAAATKPGSTPPRRRCPPQQRRVGFVFQHYALFPHLSALANVMVALQHLPTRERAAHAHATGWRAASSKAWKRAARPNFPAASSNAWRSPARWRANRRCCCSTNPSRRLIR